MRTVTIICSCHALADVRDKTIAAHKDPDGVFCGHSGERYVPSPRSGQPEVVERGGRQWEKIGELDVPCPGCHEHSIGSIAAFAPVEPTVSRFEADFAGSMPVN